MGGSRPLLCDQICGGRHVGGSGGAAQAVRNWGQRVVSELLCAPANWRESGRNRPQRYGPDATPGFRARPRRPAMGPPRSPTRLQGPGWTRAAPVAARVLDAISNDELYVFTHPEYALPGGKTSGFAGDPGGDGTKVAD